MDLAFLIVPDNLERSRHCELTGVSTLGARLTHGTRGILYDRSKSRA